MSVPPYRRTSLFRYAPLMTALVVTPAVAQNKNDARPAWFPVNTSSACWMDDEKTTVGLTGGQAYDPVLSVVTGYLRASDADKQRYSSEAQVKLSLIANELRNELPTCQELAQYRKEMQAEQDAEAKEAAALTNNHADVIQRGERGISGYAVEKLRVSQGYYRPGRYYAITASVEPPAP